MPDPKIMVVPEKCRGCGLCVKACPFGAMRMEDGVAVIDYDACTLCGACISVCKTSGAIVRTDETAATGPQTPRGPVWIFCELESRGATGLMPVSVELLGLGRELAETLNVPLEAVLIGHGLEESAHQAIAYGADRVFVADDPELAPFEDQMWAGVLAELVTAHTPDILLGGATAIGRALLPRVAVEVHTGLTADCTELTIDPDTGLLQQTRPAFGGNILATITCEHHRPQMATVRPGVLAKPEPDSKRTGEIVPCPSPASPPQNPLRWLDFVPRAAEGVDLREAEIVVSAGYGAGGPEGVALVAELARALGGVLGASRAAVDAGWVPYPHQVGQTGSTVQPKLYVACGISGAIQHIVGMQSSATIVAINRDPEAPIFNQADYAVVGDLFEILPALLRHLQERAAEQQQP